MRGLAIFVALLGMGYGFGVAGLLGALTGFLVPIAVGSGLTVLAGVPGYGLSSRLTGTGKFQRVLGALLALASTWAAFHGGWRYGWLWSAAAFALTLVLGTLAFGSAAAILSRNEKHSGREGSATYPQQFDLSDELHVAQIDEIRSTYGLLLADEQGPYAGCMFKPASMLPYPKEVIRHALTALLEFAEGRRESPYLDAGLRSEERVENVVACLLMLDDFLDLPGTELPTDSRQNATVGFAFQAKQAGQLPLSGA